MNRLVRQLLGEARSEVIRSDELVREVVLELNLEPAVPPDPSFQDDLGEPARLEVRVDVYIDNQLLLNQYEEHVSFGEDFSLNEQGWQERLAKALTYFFTNDLSGAYRLPAPEETVRAIVARAAQEAAAA